MAQGWTLHKRGNAWWFYPVIDTSALDAATTASLDRSDTPLEPSRTDAAAKLWNDVRTRVPEPKLVQNALGVINGQEIIEHLNHMEKSDALNWNYEIMRDGSGITPKDARIIALSIQSLRPESGRTIQELDILAKTITNQRYIDALLKTTKSSHNPKNLSAAPHGPPPSADFIRDSIENLVYELRQVSGKNFRQECVLVGKEQLTAEEPPMALLALTPNSRFSVVKSLQPLATAFAAVEAGSFLFEPNPQSVGGRHIAKGYSEVVSAYQNLLMKPWAIRAVKYVDGVPLTGNETFNICIYGIRPIDTDVVERLLTTLREAEDAWKSGSPKP